MLIAESTVAARRLLAYLTGYGRIKLWDLPTAEFIVEAEKLMTSATRLEFVGERHIVVTPELEGDKIYFTVDAGNSTPRPQWQFTIEHTLSYVLGDGFTKFYPEVAQQIVVAYCAGYQRKVELDFGQGLAQLPKQSVRFALVCGIGFKRRTNVEIIPLGNGKFNVASNDGRVRNELTLLLNTV